MEANEIRLKLKIYWNNKSARLLRHINLEFGIIIAITKSLDMELDIEKLPQPAGNLDRPHQLQLFYRNWNLAPTGTQIRLLW